MTEKSIGKTGKSPLKIALVLNILDEEYQTSIFAGIKSRALDKGIEIFCLQHENAMIVPNTLITKFPDKAFFNVDGVILLTSVFAECPALQDGKSIRKLWPDIPIISVGQQIPGIPSLSIRSHKAMEKLTKHLLTHHNYKRFLYMSGLEDHVDSKERKEIFERILQKQMKKDPELTYDCINGDFSEVIARENLSLYISSHRNTPADVIVCANDNMALGVYKYLKSQNGRHPWSKCAVTGFDDIPQAEMELPALTTVRQPLKEMGIKAVDLMINILSAKNAEDESYVESFMVTRESCGCKLPENKSIINNDQQITNIQRKYFQSEQFLRQMSHIAQQLNSCGQTDGLMYTLDTNLALLGIDDFALYTFPVPFSDVTPISSKNLKAEEIFLRRHGTRITQYGKILKGSFTSFLSALSNDNPGSLVVKLLHSTDGIVGCIIYDGPMVMHPYICSLSTNIAQTISRLQTMAQKEKYSEQLEKAVEKRTKELIAENNKRIEVEAEVLKISEMERQRFSTDLHDDICQRLAGLAMLCRCYSTSDKQISREQMVELTELITDTLQTTRQYAHNSFPVDLDSLGIKDALSNLCNTFQNQSKISCVYSWKLPENMIFTRPQAINIFRIIQEALQNTIKHAKATQVNVDLSVKKKRVVISISDNGQGIISSAKKRKEGIGMKSMQYRADQIEADFQIKSNSPSGTIIELSILEEKLQNS